MAPNKGAIFLGESSMAEVKIAQGVNTGPASSLKLESTNLAQAAKKADAEASAAAKSTKVEKGAVRYVTVGGQKNFSCEGIRFGAPMYTTSSKKEQATLDDMVERGMLAIDVDNRSG
jgi:hypothetical protein